MNQVPHITIYQKHINSAVSAIDRYPCSMVEVCNKAIEIALAEQNQEQYITAEEARKLGPGKAEYSMQFTSGIWTHWILCTSGNRYLDEARFKYRAIKQPEPVEPTCTRSHPHELMSAECEALTVIAKANNEKRCAELRAAEPHAELKAMYEQQVKDGTLDDFVWECELESGWHVERPLFGSAMQYRCTPKPTCQVKNLDNGEIKTMTREAAKKLQAETKDTCDWTVPNGCMPSVLNQFTFETEGIYTYKLKANLVKLDGELMTREAAATAWKSKIDTHVMWFKFKHMDWTDVIGLPKDYNEYFIGSSDCEYQLREKPTVKLTIDDEPAKMLTPAQCEAERLARIDTHDTEVTCVNFDWKSAKDQMALFHKSDEDEFEYRLIRKPLKQVSLASVPVGVMTNKGELRNVFGIKAITETSNKSKYGYTSLEHLTCTLELAPASEQPWIAVQDGKHFETELRVEGLDYHITYGAGVDDAVVRFKVVGLAEGYELK